MLTIDASVWVAADPAAGESHAHSAAFVAVVVRGGVAIHQPAICLIEVASAIARRTGDGALAKRAVAELMRLPRVMVHPMDVETALAATALAAETRLRAADSVYATLARLLDTTLVTLDRELLERASGIVPVMTPDAWLAA